MSIQSTETGAPVKMCDACKKKGVEVNGVGANIDFCLPCSKVANNPYAMYSKVFELEMLLNTALGRIFDMEKKIEGLSLTKAPKPKAEVKV